ncbi:hypothetical protein V8E36_001176 [Tilletia maclaganii]
MTRYTKLEGRKSAPARAGASLFDEAVESKKRTDGGGEAPTSKRRKLDKDSNPAEDGEPATTVGKTSKPPAPAPAPLLTKEAKLKRIKLLKLKAKKTKSDDKRKELRHEVARLEREVSSEGGSWGNGGVNSTALWQRIEASESRRDSFRSGGTSARAQGAPETNPWKLMEAERRAKTDARREKRADERQAALTCFACRGSGHSARECPNALNAHTTALSSTTLSSSSSAAKTVGKDVVGICFRCGSNAHILSLCPQKRKRRKAGEGEEEEDLPFATCFVCTQTGHLASACPQNAERGVFPMGGGNCAICKSVRHRARDCPEAKLEGEDGKDESGVIEEFEGADGAAALNRRQAKRKSAGTAGAATAISQPPRKKVVNF